MTLESIYKRLPVSLQHASCGFEGWRIKVTRYGGQFPVVLRGAQERGAWTEDRVRDYRDRRLRSFIQCCIALPFYKDRFRVAGVDPASIRTLEDLGALPILTKEEVRTAKEEFSLLWKAGRKTIAAHTSGTTGSGLHFMTDLRAVQEQWAIWWRYRSWHGIQPGVWQAYFTGRSIVPITQAKPPFWRWNPALSQLMFSVYHLSPANLDFYIDELSRRKIPWLHGYPSALALVAARTLERGGLGYTPQWITVGAESLLPQQLSLITEAFGVRPRQHYGMAEAAANISECEAGRLHVDEDFAAVEFVPTADDSHTVIGTNFSNPLTPLLRYEVGDRVTLDESKCTCGHPGRVVKTIDGRREDYVVLANGARIGRLDHVFKDLLTIREAQIYQQRAGAITVRLVRGAGYSVFDEMALLRELRSRVGSSIDIKIEHRDKLERFGAGKLRFVISELPQGKLLSVPSGHVSSNIPVST